MTSEGVCVVLYPAHGVGHLISMIELGKRFLLLSNARRPISVTVLVVPDPPLSTTPMESHLQRLSAAYHSIIFHRLPPIVDDDYSSPPNARFIISYLRLANPLVLQALQTISRTTPVRALVLDFFCACALDVAVELNIPPFFFFTSSASTLAVLLQIVNQKTTSPDALIHLHGMPPLLASDMPPGLDIGNESTEVSSGFRDIFRRMKKADGIMVNSFEPLEPRALKMLADGLCVPDGPTPPVYAVGPLMGFGSGEGEGGQECLPWLDAQPPRSVVFLCFGSLGVFSAEQLKEMAVGLEKSEQRFLWVVRPPSQNQKTGRLSAPTSSDTDLESLMPEGFLERTRERGMVVKSWAPQVAVLNRESVGGFVTHCGWNSILEAVCAGVPMAGWPLYAEQRMNRVLLIKELKLGFSVGEDVNGFVSAAELEKRVRSLLESEEGREVRERAEGLRESASAALKAGGSSYTALVEFVESLTRS